MSIDLNKLIDVKVIELTNNSEVNTYLKEITLKSA